MKKVNKAATIPLELTAFVDKYPSGTPEHCWKNFDDDRPAKKAVQQQLWKDQKGLCAYCEIDLTSTAPNRGGASLKGDFRIEHFHPKSDKNGDWAFDWQNMLGICTGGDERNLEDATRVAESKKEQHCDSRKGEKILDGVILNPLKDVPAFPAVFTEDAARGTSEKFYFCPEQQACEAMGEGVFAKAQRTLDELNLNCELLARLRRKSLDKWVALVEHFVAEGKSPDEAIESAMRMAFPPEAEVWPPFFSAIRAHFGMAAEKQLHSIGYDG